MTTRSVPDPLPPADSSLDAMECAEARLQALLVACEHAASVVNGGGS